MFLNKVYIAAACAALGSLMCGAGCHNDSGPPKAKIEKIMFEKEQVTIKVDEETTVKVTVKPDEAKKNEKIEYTSVNKGIIEIREPTNDGFIIKGLQGGSTVIMAKSKQVTSYLEVVVQSDSVIVHYINVGTPVIELHEGERKTTQVSLYGGNSPDNNDFVWKLENGKDNIRLDATANIGVIEGLRRGYQKIIVEHPKAEFASEILVFISGYNDPIRYISSASNVVLVPNDDQYHNFQVLLVNGIPEDVIDFEYEIYEGSDVINIVYSETVCNILGKKSGTAIVRVKHPKAVMDFDVRIIVYDVAVPFITLDKTFLLMNIGENANIAGQVENARNTSESVNQFSFEKIESKENVVEVIQNNNYFFIRANQGGNARIVISNEQTELSREILVIIREEIIYRDDYYITTTQNVITTQVGTAEIQLNMQLINGTTADANSFEWVVEDGTVIQVESAHGTVRGNRAQINSVFNAVAMITAKKAGTSKITISHPKAEASASILVKVYPKGTFAETPIIIGLRDTTTPPATAQNPVTGLFHIGGNEAPAQRTITAYTISGDILDVGSLDWKTNDAALATVTESVRGLTNILRAVPGKSGLTKIAVNGNNLTFPHETLVAVDMPGASIIYVDNVYQTIAEKQVVNIEVKDSNNEYKNSTEFTVQVEKPELLYAVMAKNRLMLQGKQRGETKVIIHHPYAVNDITINVRVEPATIIIDKPYYIGGPEIVGVVRGYAKDIAVTLAGAPESEQGKLQWSIDDSSAATLLGNGIKAIVTGKISDKQTKLWIKHKEDKSENEKMILLYVVENEADLNNKVALGLESENYLMVAGEEKLISLITNVSDSQKAGLKWTVKKDDGSVIEDNYENSVIRIEQNYSSAMMFAKAAGYAEIIVSHPQNILPLTIYVSVVDALSVQKQIKSPAVVELLTGVGKIVGLSTLNLTQGDKSGIAWNMEDGSKTLANVEGNGDSGYMLGLKEGVGYLTINQNSLGYKHRATVVCADTPERLASMYIIGIEESYHVLKVGEEKKIQLTFGSNGFPEDKKSGLVWKADLSGSVSVTGQGDKAVIIARAVGDAVVTVSDPGNTALNNPFEIKVNVRSNIGTLEFRDYDKIIGIVRGNTKQTAVKLFEGANEVKTGYSNIDHSLEDKINSQFTDVNKASSVIDVNQTNNIFDIAAKTTGESKVKITHKQVNDPAVVLVYTANSEDELARYYPVVADKTNYLLQVGETAAIRINTLTEKDSLKDETNQTNLERIQWGIENASIVNLTKISEKERVVKGLMPGLSVVNINYKGQTVERVFVTVVENNAVDMTKYIMTENIIGLVKGTSKTTKIHSNLTNTESGTLQWESSDTDIVTVSGSGDTAVITAKNVSGNVNEAYVTVSYGSWLKRHILVYVCQDDANASAYKAMNMEEQYYRMGRNETLVLPGFFAPVKTSIPTVWSDKYGNNVVKFTEKDLGSKIEVTSLNEGVAVLEAVNTGLSNAGRVLRVYIEVSNRYNNAARAVRIGYLTTLKTIYLLNPQDPAAQVTLNVSGIGMNFEELNRVTWTLKSGSTIVSITPNGPNCIVRHNGLELKPPHDTAIIEAAGIDNIIQFKVIVSTRELLGIPYIDGEDVIRVGKNGTVSMSYEVAEMTGVDNSQFLFTPIQNADKIEVSYAGNTVQIKGRETGQALLRASYTDTGKGVIPKDILVVVTSTPDGLMYLTTRDNFNVVTVGEYKTLSVEMIGFEDAGTTYTWSVNDATIVTNPGINSSGKQAQVQALATGEGKTAAIRVHNSLFGSSTLYDVLLYVRVTATATPTAYMTTKQNVLSVTKGNTSLVEMELVGGDAQQAEAFTFESLDKDKFSVTQAGNRALIKGESVGNGRLRVTNNYALNATMTLFVVVQPVQDDNGIYIVSDYTIIDVKPNETRNIAVRLINGKLSDNSLFSWEIGIQNSIIKNPITGLTQTVIQLPPSAGPNNAIKGINEGEATIIVRNAACPNYELHIQVYVRETSAIQFSLRNLTLTVGETMYIPLTAPTGIVVMYESKNPNVVFVSPSTGTGALSTNQLCYVRGEAVGTTVVTAKSSSGTTSDEIIITVIAKALNSMGYIRTPDIVYNMTDWQSALNRLVLVGTPVGNKNENGTPFSNNDDQGIFWEIDEPHSNVIGFGLNNVIDPKDRQIKEHGKTANVYSLKPGLGKIMVSHDAFLNGSTAINKGTDNYQMIYINVVPYDANFSVTPLFIQSQTNQVVSVTATIANIVDKNYENVVWTISPPGAAKFVTIDSGGTERDVTKDPYNGESKVSIKILEDQPFSIRATYDGRTTIESQVYVEKEKYLELLIESSFIQLLPNGDAYVPFKVEPVETNVDTWQESTRFSSVVRAAHTGEFLSGSIAPYYNGTAREKDKYGDEIVYKTIDWNLIPSDATHILHIRASDIDGFNKIELRSHGHTITKLMTVETNHRYMFKLDGVTAVRGKPGDTVTVKYLVEPAGDPVTFSGKTYEGENTIVDESAITINYSKGNQTISFTLIKAGYNEYNFESEYNKPNGLKLVVPVYCYYEETIPVQWELTNNQTINTNVTTRMVGDAIFLAGGTPADITIRRESGNIIKGSNGVDYYATIKLSLDTNGTEINDSNIRKSGFEADDIFIQNIEGNGTLYKSLLKSEYKGLLKIRYTYYAGNSIKSTFYKTFMIYAETWD
jgi:hypothetical protein